MFRTLLRYITELPPMSLKRRSHKYLLGLVAALSLAAFAYLNPVGSDYSTCSPQATAQQPDLHREVPNPSDDDRELPELKIIQQILRIGQQVLPVVDKAL